VEGAHGRPGPGAPRRARTTTGGSAAKSAAGETRARAASGCTAGRGRAATAGAPAIGEGAREEKSSAQAAAKAGGAPAAAGPGPEAAPASNVCRHCGSAPPVATAGSAGGEEVEGGDHRCAQGKRCDGGAERGRGAPPRHEGTGGTEKARQRGREGNGRAPPGTRAYGSALRASGEIRGGAAGKVGGERASEDGASPWGSGTFPPPGGGAGGVVARTCDGWERGGGKTRKGRPAGVDGARGRPKTAAHRRARTPSGGPVAQAAASCNRARAARGCTAARGWAALAGAPASGEGARDAKCAAEVAAEVGRAPAAAGPGQVAAPAAAVCRRGCGINNVSSITSVLRPTVAKQ